MLIYLKRYVSIPFEQGDVFRHEATRTVRIQKLSQSLSSRAMSFDEVVKAELREFRVSIPFEQGDVFRHKCEANADRVLQVSIPFEQGDVFRQRTEARYL